MLKNTSPSLLTELLLLLSLGNLTFSAMAFVRCPSEDLSSQPFARIKWSTLAIGLAGSSQLLYLVFVAAWIFRWLRFYPGNPIEMFAIFAGLTLSGAAFLTALFGAGLTRWAGVLSSAVTAFLWLLAAIASVAV